MPRVFTLAELIAEYPELRLSRKVLRRLLNDGDLVGFKLTGDRTSAWRIDERDWNTFLNDRRTAGRQAAS